MDDEAAKRLEQFLKEHTRWAADNKRAHTISDLVMLSFLVDSQVATVEEISQRIAEVQKVLPESHQDDTVTNRLEFLTRVLRAVYDQPQPKWTPQVIEGGLGDDHSPPLTDPHKDDS